jgi:hypothetical protein
MLHICGVSKMYGEWYQKTNKTEDTNKLNLLAFKIIIILHNTRLATFIKLLETVIKGLFYKCDYTVMSHTAKRLFVTYKLKIKSHMVTCFGVFIYAIIRPADIQGNF